MLSKTFHLDGMTNYGDISQLLFTKKHIRDIASFIPWRETTALGHVRTARRCYCASKEEALCLLLERLALPSRVEDLEKRCFRSKAAITEIFYEALECFLLWAGPLVSTFQADFLQTRAEYYSSKISENLRMQRSIALGSSTELSLRSLDRVAFGKERPIADTRDLKWQVITTPDGMLFHIFGPYEGRRHDMHLYAEPGLDDILSKNILIDGVKHYLFVDMGYALRPYLMTPFEGANLNANELLFNKRMSKARVSVECTFKDIKKYFSHIAFLRKIALSRAPGGTWYLASCLLCNFRCCIDGSPSSTFFDCQPPTLSHYLALLETVDIRERE
jgi:nuclease HARBI1